MSKSLDLTGMKFGALTAIQRVENINGRAAWLCRCECGNEIVVLTKRLRAGKIKSCGCRNPGLESLHFIDGTCIEMLQSNTIRSNNKSGVTGVFRDSRSSKWRAEIMFKGKRTCLGRFDTYDQAVKARQEAEKRLHDSFVDIYKSQLDEDRY